ncbi:15083_t:CDS:1 [Racocetra fulgida]|uniref:15083_t:CDS:1 n=1 Tax=Racocetra fulgida TaxID=60492 RepID=A0A9N9CS11_9GLOM|nr:15083_t:CDS:1 [Racocetra fulgida]
MLKYRICKKDFDVIINHDSVNGGTYGPNFMLLQTDKSNVSISLQGCTKDCFMAVEINFDQNKLYNSLGDNNYACFSSSYTANINVDMQILYTGVGTNSKHPAPPSLTYEYCLKGINIDTGAPLNPKPDPGIASCISHLLGQTAPAFYPGPFGNYLNIEAKRYLEYPVNNSSPSIARLVFASKNYLTYLSIFYDGIKYSFNQLNHILPNMVDDLTPHAKTGPNMALINILLIFSTIIGAINFAPFILPLGTIAGAEFGFFMQRIISGVISIGATNLGSKGNPEGPVRNLGELQNQAESNMLNSLQSVVDDTFNHGFNYTIIDKYIDFNDSQYSDVNVGNALLPGLKAAFASHILNFYGVVVCKPDNIQSICEHGDNSLCCDWEAVGRSGPSTCLERFKCNNPVGSPVNCIIQGGYKKWWRWC